MKEKPFHVRLECQHSRWILNPKSGKRMLVGCGKCVACRSKRSNQWFVRLRKEMDNSESAYFLTLTYDKEHVPYLYGIPTFQKSDVQKFIKRIRKNRKHLSGYKRKSGMTMTRIKYFAVSEYGSNTLRPHYHIILFNLPSTDLDEVSKYIHDNWKLGFTSVGLLNSKRIKYTAKYCTAFCVLPKEYTLPAYRPFLLCSNGLGSCYLTDETVRYHQSELDTTVMVDSYRYGMPRYYRNKIFDEVTREMLAEAAEAEMDEYRHQYFLQFYDYDCNRWTQSVIEPDTIFPGRKGEVYVNFERKVKSKIKGKINKV